MGDVSFSGIVNSFAHAHSVIDYSNEAFASQAVYSIEALKIPYEKVNPVGG